jgi:hypothetical protein
MTSHKKPGVAFWATVVVVVVLLYVASFGPACWLNERGFVGMAAAGRHAGSHGAPIPSNLTDRVLLLANGCHGQCRSGECAQAGRSVFGRQPPRVQ